jgi:hypothetical protein
MGMPEVTGDKPQNHGLSDFKKLPEQRGVGPRVQKPEELKQQPADPELKAYRQLQREPRGSTIFVSPLRVPRPLPQNLGEQREEGVRGEVQQEPASHQEHPVGNLDEFRQLARQALNRDFPDQADFPGHGPFWDAVNYKIAC